MKDKLMSFEEYLDAMWYNYVEKNNKEISAKCFMCGKEFLTEYYILWTALLEKIPATLCDNCKPYPPLKLFKDHYDEYVIETVRELIR